MFSLLEDRGYMLRGWEIGGVDEVLVGIGEMVLEGLRE